MRQSLLILSVTTLVTFSSAAIASGGGGYSSGGYSSNKVDQRYELGKSYFRSRQADGRQLEYCVRNGSELTKLSRRSVKGFKRGPVSNFVDSLYSCADPSAKIADLVPADQGSAILYYLNKRFKLRLSNS